jgi:glycosyltransferase involved in cell wall biosynthesis
MGQNLLILVNSEGTKPPQLWQETCLIGGFYRGTCEMNARFPEHASLLRDLRHSESIKRRPCLSVVVPCVNQEEVLPAANRRLHGVLDGIHMDFEIVYVDDGSTDSTPDILREFQVFDSRVRVVRLSKGFGREIALVAGLEHASGDAVAFTDAALKNPPEIISEFVKRWQEGFDVVLGDRTHRVSPAPRHSGWGKAWQRLRDHFLDSGMSLDAGHVHLMDRKAVDALLSRPDRRRFVQEVANLSGFSRTILRYEGAPGSASHKLWKALRIIREGLVAVSVVPLRLAIWVGFLCAALSMVGILAVAFGKVFNAGLIKGWTSGMIAVLFIGGVQLICLGAIGEYIRRLYDESKRHSGYSVREKAGFEPPRRPTAFDVYTGIAGNTH